MIHHQQHRPESSHKNDGFREAKSSRRGLASIIFLLIFLMSVSMTVTNMHHTSETLPQTFDPFLHHLQAFAVQNRPKQYTETMKVDPVRTKGADNALIDKSGNLKSPGTHASMATTKAEIEDDVQKHDRKPTIRSKNQTVHDDKMADEQATPVSDSSELLSVVPDDNNTVISLISMGSLVETYTVERCIRSIRRRGMFTGVIMLFTDGEGYKQYQETIPFVDNQTMVIQGRDEDLHPREKINDGNNQFHAPLKKYAQKSMVFKRFKTHHSKYIEGDPALSDSVRFVVYIDVDNIIGSRMDSFFKDYAKMVADRYPKADAFHRNFTLNANGAAEKLVNKTEGGSFGFMSMFRDRHLKSKMHSGIIVYDRAFEYRCVTGWKNEMDTFWHSSDQQMFLRVLDDYDRYRCTVFDLPPNHMNFANKQIMGGAMEERQGMRKKKKPLKFPTFIHVTQYRVRRLNNATIYSEFLRHLLRLETNDEPMTDEISWEDVVSPTANRNATRY